MCLSKMEEYEFRFEYYDRNCESKLQAWFELLSDGDKTEYKNLVLADEKNKKRVDQRVLKIHTFYPHILFFI